MYLSVVFVTLFLVYNVSAKNDEIKQKMKVAGMQCMQEHSIGMAELQQLKQKEVPESAKCFLECVFKKLHFFNDQGMFDSESVKTMSQEYFGDDAQMLQQAQAFADDCSSVNNEQVDGCARAGLLQKCVLEKAPQYGLTP